MYKIVNKYNEELTMRNGQPFTYSTKALALLGVKFLRPKTAKSDRPLRVVTI